MGKFVPKKSKNFFVDFKLIINIRQIKLLYLIINRVREAAKRKK